MVVKGKGQDENLLIQFNLQLKSPTPGLSCRKSLTSLTTGWLKSLSNGKFARTDT